MSQKKQPKNITKESNGQENSTLDHTHDQFIQSNPLSFELYNFYDPSNRNLLYINDEPDNLRFNLEIKNLLKETIFLDPHSSKKADDKGPNENNFHIELQFKAGELSQKSLQLIDLSEKSKEEWSMGRRQPSGQNNTFSIFLRKRKSKLEIKGKDADSNGDPNKATITLVGIGANSVMGARASQLNVNCQGFYLDKIGSFGIKNNLIILTILNHSGERSAPLIVKFAHSPRVLNNGTEQNITIHITNNGQESIGFNENSKFEIIIDTQGEGDAEPWALAKKDQADKISNLLVLDALKDEEKNNKTENWIIETNKEGIDPIWIIKPKLEKNILLKPNKDIFFRLKEFRTSLQAGIGNLYVGYYNLSGYRDEVHTLGVDKTCITEQSNKIGINKFPDADVQLDVKGKIAADTLKVKTQEVSNSLTVTGTVTANQFVGLGAFVQGMIIMWSGSVNNIPDGWALCNGQNGTPDLCDRFIIAAGKKYDPNSIGGREKVTLVKENMPAHKHEVQDNGHTHKTTFWKHWRSFSGAHGKDKPLKNCQAYDKDASHAETSYTSYSNISIKNSGKEEPDSFKIIPLYFSLAFIMYMRS